MFINPKTDFAFKKIFGSKKSKDILISFLNAILYSETVAIADLEILDPYQAPRIKGIKDSFLDVKATLKDGQTVIIEMQVLNVLGFEKRVLYNAAKAFSIQLNVGEDYTLLNPIIALTITDFEMFPQSQKVISSYALREKDELTNYSDDIELVFVELPKFQKSLEELASLSDKWIYFLRYANQLQAIPPTMEQEPAISHAFEVAQQSKLTRKELEVLEKREMFLHDNRNAIRYAEQKGLEKGRQEGRQEGRKDAAIEIARQLFDVLDLETIAQKTGLTLTELRAALPVPQGSLKQSP
jgi:predicted transposase/invertase (TIGR01784 family)